MYLMTQQQSTTIIKAPNMTIVNIVRPQCVIIQKYSVYEGLKSDCSFYLYKCLMLILGLIEPSDFLITQIYHKLAFLLFVKYKSDIYGTHAIYTIGRVHSK